MKRGVRENSLMVSSIYKLSCGVKWFKDMLWRGNPCSAARYLPVVEADPDAAAVSRTWDLVIGFRPWLEALLKVGIPLQDVERGRCFQAVFVCARPNPALCVYGSYSCCHRDGHHSTAACWVCPMGTTLRPYHGDTVWWPLSPQQAMLLPSMASTMCTLVGNRDKKRA